MIRKLAIAITVVSVYGGASASTSAISNDALDADRAGGAQAGPQAFSISANPAAPVQILDHLVVVRVILKTTAGVDDACDPETV